MTSPTSLSTAVLPVSASPTGTRPTNASDPASVMKAAKDFEAMAIGQLLQPMFDTVDPSSGEFGGGAGEQAWRPMMVQEYAKQLVNHGGLGLAKPIYEAMMRAQQGGNAQ
jgi:peptidoglycan hydrolase FlgJ